jgi:hypothetical protein
MHLAVRAAESVRVSELAPGRLALMPRGRYLGEGLLEVELDLGVREPVRA